MVDNWTFFKPFVWFGRLFVRSFFFAARLFKPFFSTDDNRHKLTIFSCRS